MSLMQALLQRLLPLFGGLFASQVETGIVLEQAEQLNQIEERARQFEREGKAELAEALRRQFTRIQSDDPGRTGLRILENLGEKADSPALLTAENSEPEQTRRSSGDGGSKRRTRRTSRRTASQSKPLAQPTEDEEGSCCD